MVEQERAKEHDADLAVMEWSEKGEGSGVDESELEVASRFEEEVAMLIQGVVARRRRVVAKAGWLAAMAEIGRLALGLSLLLGNDME